MAADPTPVLVGLALVGVAATVSQRRGLGIQRELAVTVARALVQLGLVAVVIQAIFDHLGLSGLFVVVMVTAAAITAGRRMTSIERAGLLAATTIAVAAGAGLVPLFAVGAFPLTPRYVIPVAGILIGGAMKATSLAGLRLVLPIVLPVLPVTRGLPPALLLAVLMPSVSPAAHTVCI